MSGTVRLALAVVLGAVAVWHFAATAPASAPAPAPPVAASAPVARGAQLFRDGCSSCHGLDARGLPGRGPSLYGAGALSADFYLSTGRMPLSDPKDPPTRTRPAYPPRDVDALVAYVGSLGGPPIPRVNVAAGDLGAGRQAFTEHCAGCHQELARGGIVTGAVAPALQKAAPAQVAEAVRIGPYLMPAFSARQIDDRSLNDITRYVEWTKRPADVGGWGIGHIGPIPEGMLAWLLALAALLIVARLIGERNPT